MPVVVLLAVSSINLPVVLTGIFLIISLFLVLNLSQIRKKNREYELLINESERKINLLHEELELVKKKAEESDRLKSSFLANMSHEIRTPLNAIMGFSSLLQTVADNEQEFEQYINIIHDNSNKLLDMMDEIFNIALIESGITRMYKEECQINELLTSLVTFFNIEKEIKDKQGLSIRIKKSTRDNAFTIYTDPRKLRQTLYNLIENALKYTSQGYIEIGYELKDNSMVEFYVRDTGAGFPQEKLDVIFKQFRQVDDSNTRNYGGIGLGLTLSQKFVEMMGGHMWGESSPGNGSIFYFTLPHEQKELETTS